MDTNPTEGQPVINNPEPIQSQAAAPQNQQPVSGGSEGLGTASMVLGIISLIIFPVSFVLAVIGLILGIVYKSKGGKKISGIIMNSIALGLNVVSVILAVILVTVGVFSFAGFMTNATIDVIDDNNIDYIYDDYEDDDWGLWDDEEDDDFSFDDIEQKQVQCTAPEGVITLTYDEENLTGSFSFGDLEDFDLDAAQERAEKIGIDSYIEEFINDFETAHPDGSCEKE